MTSTPRVSNPVSIRCELRSSRRKSPAAISAISDSATCDDDQHLAQRQEARASRAGRSPTAPARSSAPARRPASTPGARAPVRTGCRSAARAPAVNARTRRIQRQRLRIDGEGQRQFGGDDRVERPGREHHAGDAAEDREQQALGHQLPHQARALARRAPAGSRPRAGACVARESSRLAMLAQAISSTMPTTIISTVDCWTRTFGPLAVGIQARLEQRHRRGAPSLVVDRERLLEIGEDRLEVRARLFGGHARASAARR